MEGQRQQLCKTKDRLTITQEQIGALKKKLGKANEAVAQAEQEGYDTGWGKLKKTSRPKFLVSTFLQVWTEALNQAGVDASSALRRAENVFYPPALRVEGPSNSQADVVPKVPEPNKVAPTSTLLASTDPSKKADRASTADKEKEPVKEKASEPTKLPPAPKDSSKAKGTT